MPRRERKDREKRIKDREVKNQKNKLSVKIDEPEIKEKQDGEISPSRSPSAAERGYRSQKRAKEKEERRNKLKSMTPEERAARRLEMRWQRDLRMWEYMCTKVAARWR